MWRRGLGQSPRPMGGHQRQPCCRMLLLRLGPRGSGPGRTPALSPPAGQPATWAGEQAGRGSWGRAARHVRCIGRNQVHGAQWRAPGGGRAQARRGRRRDRRSLGARRRQLCRALRARVLSGHRCGPNQLFMATWALGQVGARGAAAAVSDAEPVTVRAAGETGAGCVGCAAAACVVAEDEQARQVANVALVVVAG